MARYSASSREGGQDTAKSAFDDEARSFVVGSVEKKASAVLVTVGGSSFLCADSALADAELDPACLVAGRELAESEARALKTAAAATEARRRALALLARAEQTRHLLAVKLAQRGLEARGAGLALDRLEAEGLLSDRRFAEAWLGGHGGRAGAGPKKLLAALRAKGIDEETANQAFKTVFGADERSSLLAATGRKELARLRKKADMRSSELKAELVSRLRAQGYRSDEIRNWLESMAEGAGE